MTDIDVRIVGGRAAAVFIGNVSKQAAIKLRTAVQVHSSLLKTRIMANASGRPGPNAPTGDYRRSWSVELHTSTNMFSGVVGTNAPQGRRLEFGFVGVDSLGRHYNQQPYPHVGPAFDAIAPQFTLACLDALGRR